jgi:hypothetical protein
MDSTLLLLVHYTQNLRWKLPSQFQPKCPLLQHITLPMNAIPSPFNLISITKLSLHCLRNDHLERHFPIKVAGIYFISFLESDVTCSVEVVYYYKSIKHNIQKLCLTLIWQVYKQTNCIEWSIMLGWLLYIDSQILNKSCKRLAIEVNLCGMSRILNVHCHFNQLQYIHVKY